MPCYDFRAYIEGLHVLGYGFVFKDFFVNARNLNLSKLGKVFKTKLFTNCMITFEALFDVLRAEKSSQELQKLEPDFYEQVASYIKDKQDFLLLKASQVLSSVELEKEKQQLKNIKRMVRDIYDRRVFKIALLALNASRIGLELIDLSPLLEVEKSLFSKLYAAFKNERDLLLSKTIESSFEGSLKPGFETSMHGSQESVGSISQGVEQGVERSASQGTSQPSVEKSHSDLHSQEHSEDLVVVKFLQQVPRFVDSQGNVLGPFDIDDVAAIPKPIAEVLIEKHRAEMFLE